MIEYGEDTPTSGNVAGKQTVTVWDQNGQPKQITVPQGATLQQTSSGGWGFATPTSFSAIPQGWTPTAPKTGEPEKASTAKVEITGSGGELYIPPDSIPASVAPPGSVVTATVDGITVKTPDGKVASYEVPSETKVQEIQAEVDKINTESEKLNQDIAAFNQREDATTEDYQALEARVAAFNVRASELSKTAEITNVLIGMRNREAETRPEPIQPKMPKKGTKDYALIGADIAAEVVLPGYYTATHWNDMKTWEKVLSIGLDVVSVVPFLGAAGRGAKAATVLTKAGRIKAAVIGVKTIQAGKVARIGGLVPEAIRTVTFPVELVKSIRHPVATVKALTLTTKDMLSGIENFIRPTKLPETVVISTMHSAKIPVKVLGSGEDTMKLRDALMVATKRGDNIVNIEAGDKLFQMHSVPLMKKTGGLAHGAQDITLFDTGLVVMKKPNKPMIEQGLFAAPNPIGRYALGEAAIAGKIEAKSGIFICSKEYAQKYARSSRKLFAGTAELESVFDIGREMEKPAQKLFTRIEGERVEIYLAKKLSKKQILELKAKGLTEQIKSLYTPTVELKGKGLKGLTSKQVDDLADVVYKSDKTVARNLRRVNEARRLNPGILLSSALRVGGVARLIDVRTRVDVRNITKPRVTTVRKVADIKPRSGQTLDDAVREAVAQRTDRATRAGFSEVVPTRPSRKDTERDKTPRVDVPRAGIPRVDVPRAGIPRVDIPRGGKPRVDIPRTEVGRVEPPRPPRPPDKKPVPPRVRVMLPGGRQKVLTGKQLEGAWTWRQGELGEDIWKLWYPPYSRDTLVTTIGKPPYAAEVSTGIGSAQRTLKPSGDVKTTPTVNMGAVSVRVEEIQPNVGRLVYKRLKRSPRAIHSEVTRG